MIRAAIEPALDPRLDRAGEASQLRNQFMEREAVLPSAAVAKHAGVRNPSHAALRWRKQGKIFSVSYRGKDYFPAFQFDADDGRPYPQMKLLLALLRGDTTMTDWDIALWFTTPNGYLSGQHPKALLCEAREKNSERLRHAAEQEVAADDE